LKGANWKGRDLSGIRSCTDGRSRAAGSSAFSRTFAALIEALDPHRDKGQQRITVEHVNVHPGGQAIVGAVTSRRESPKSKEQTGATREIIFVIAKSR